MTTRTFSGEPSGTYVLRSDRTEAPFAGKCPLDCLYKDLGWFYITLKATNASPQMIGKHGRVRTGGFVWSQVTVTAMIAELLTVRTSRKLAIPVVGIIV